LGADDVPAAKPQPDGLFKLCELMNLNPTDCIYIGDAPTDGQAARNANMIGIGVLWGSYSAEKVYDAFPYVARDVSELENIIESIICQNN
jgi:phosphoglycolate phosphatase-like HAD superfamily hydrolase